MNPGILLALVFMLCLGIADFLTKKIVTTVSVKAYMLWGQPMNALILFAFVPLLGGLTPINSTGLAYAVITGIFLVSGVACFFLAMRDGAVSLVTALSSVYPVITIVLGILILGETLRASEALGISIALLGMLIASTETFSLRGYKPKNIGLIGLAVLFWGVGFFFYALATESLGWLTASALQQTTQALVILPFVFSLSRAKDMLRAHLLPRALICQSLVVLGTFAYAFAISFERTSLITPISALYPLVAILLAFIFLKERLRIHQYGGIIAVLCGVVLVSV